VEYYPGLAGLENAAETRILRLQFGGVWNAVASGTIQTNAYAAPPMPPSRTKFPVLIFSPGGQAPVLAYQLQLEELASHGYVVFALEHGTDSALMIRPDGTMSPYVSRRPADPLPTVAYLEAVRDEAIRRTADIVFSVNQVSLLAKQPGSAFHNRLDLSRIGVFGHSAGGQAAIRTCQIDARVRACLNQDGEMFGIPLGSTEPIPTPLPGKPTLAPVAVIYVAEPGIPDAQLAAVNVTRRQDEDWRAAKNRALRSFLQTNSRESYLVTITAPGFVHATFMDVRLLVPNPNTQNVLNHRTATNITRAFFDAHLRCGDQNNWSRFAIAPGPGIAIEKLSIRPGLYR
jgi:dienelactone hydrolase